MLGSVYLSISLSASVVGTWTVTALEGTDGKAVSIDDYATANGVDPETLKCTYTFAEDGKFSGEMSGVTVSGNYTVCCCVVIN